MTREPHRRHFGRWLLAGLALGAAAAIAAAAVPRLTAGPPDYRDPLRLASAVKAAHGGMGSNAACARLAGSDFMCTVALPNGTEGVYQVSVSADGRSWKAR